MPADTQQTPMGGDGGAHRVETTRAPAGITPHYYGGQAVIEGVMMRGARCWSVAVRRPSGEIYLERHPTSDLPQRKPIWAKPMFRGMFGLVDALTIGTRALSISANASLDEDERLSSKQIGGSLILALLAFVGVFIVLPNVGLAFLARATGTGLVYHLLEGLIRIALFLGYLFGMSAFADIRRVFAYHGAEHKTIAAWEHGERLEPGTIDRYSTLHVRCGTNFLLMVMLIAILTYTLVGVLVPAPPGGAVVVAVYQILLRILLLPVVAGLAYEGLRLGAGRDNLAVRALMKPGMWLQMMTTKPPTDDQIEVAVRAFEAVVPVSELAGRTSALPSPVVWGTDSVGAANLGLPRVVDG
ncbi:MAG: DUF1385 domain-containing protein [Egibacteraceae bacterium]